MKHLLLFALPFVGGCHTAPTRHSASTPSPVISVARPLGTAAIAPLPPASPTLEQRLRQQSQFIEALINQNDALAASLASRAQPESPHQAPPSVLPVALQTVPAFGKSSGPASDAALAPNAEGVIDLCAIATPEAGTPANPFAVRTIAPDSMREISLRVGGVVAGPVACVIINDRLLQAGDSLESLTVERVDAGSVYLRHEGRRLRLPISAKPVRVRLPL